jgi:hypothetical protein
MFIKIIDTRTHPDGFRPDYAITEETRCAIINVDSIEAITKVKGCDDKIKIHLRCQKEFKADIECLDIIVNNIQMVECL